MFICLSLSFVVLQYVKLFLYFCVKDFFSPFHQESLSEVEEKYKKAMVSNAQLDNEKANLIYQVDTLKDVLEEMEEQMSELRRETEEKSKVLMLNLSFLENCCFIKLF